jgi:hypothetical protein
MSPIISAILGMKELEKSFVSYAEKDHELRIKEIEHKGFKAWWRPFLMFGFGTIIMLYCFLYYILPGILVYFPNMDWVMLIQAPKVDPALWNLVMYSIIGIGGMRTIDKYRKK